MVEGQAEATVDSEILICYIHPARENKPNSTWFLDGGISCPSIQIVDDQIQDISQE